MTLKEKLCEPFGGLTFKTSNQLEDIADIFAIDFAKWIQFHSELWISFSTRELLQIYKKEKEL